LQKSPNVEAAEQTPLPPAAGGSAHRPAYQSSYIVNSSLCIYHTKQQTLSESIEIPNYFLAIIIAGVHQAFGVKIMLHFVCHRLRKL